MMVGIRRPAIGLMLVVAVLVLGGCGSEDEAGSSDTYVPQDTWSSTLTFGTDPTWTTGPPPTLSPGLSCVLDQLTQGATPEAAQGACEFEVWLSTTLESMDLRTEALSSFSMAQPALGFDDAWLTSWVDAACAEGPPVVERFVDSLESDGVDRAALFSPLLDFTAVVNNACPGADLDGFAASSWVAISSGNPTDVVDELTSGFVYSSVSQQLFEDVHSPCDVVGNAAVLLVESLQEGNLPTWGDALISQGVSYLCGGLM